MALLPVPRPRQVPLPRPCRRTRLGDGAGDGDSLLGPLRPPRERGRGRVGAAGGRNSAPLRAGILEIGNLIEEPFTAYESQRRPLLPLTEARREDAERVAEAQPRCSRCRRSPSFAAREKRVRLPLASGLPHDPARRARHRTVRCARAKLLDADDRPRRAGAAS